MDTLTCLKDADLGSPHHPLRRPAVRTSAVQDDDNRPAGTCLNGTQLSIYRSFEECASLRRTAVETCSCFVFQTFEWHSTWYATIGQAEGVRTYIVHLADDTGRTLLILPLGIYCRKGLRFLCFLGGIVTDYNVSLLAKRNSRLSGGVSSIAFREWMSCGFSACPIRSKAPEIP